MTLSRVFGRLAFAFLLLFAQQQAVTHPISHLGAAQERSARGPAEQAPDTDLQCQRCVACASLAVALSGMPAAFLPPDMVEALAWRTVQSDHVPGIVPAFRSRAPPRLS